MFPQFPLRHGVGTDSLRKRSSEERNDSSLLYLKLLFGLWKQVLQDIRKLKN